MGIVTERPWGKFEILKHTDTFWIKLLTIKPLQRLSLQSHNKRNEHWVVIKGEGIAEVDNEKGILETGSIINVPIETLHRVYNTSKTDELLICEIAIGDCDESDIVRYADDYGRKIKTTE